MPPVGDVEEQEGRGEDDEGAAVHVLLVPLHQLLRRLLAAVAALPFRPPQVLEDPRGRRRRRDVLHGGAAAGGGHDGAGGGAHRVILDGGILGRETREST